MFRGKAFVRLLLMGATLALVISVFYQLYRSHRRDDMVPMHATRAVALAVLSVTSIQIYRALED